MKTVNIPLEKCRCGEAGSIGFTFSPAMLGKPFFVRCPVCGAITGNYATAFQAAKEWNTGIREEK